MVNVVMIGTGNALLEHKKSWESIKGVTLVGILDTHSGSLKSDVSQEKALYVNEMNDIKQRDVDMVDICVPFNERAEWIKKVADMNMDIVCTEPFGKTPEDMMAIIESCKENTVAFYPDHVFHNRPAYANAQAQIRRGAIGQPGVLRFAVNETHPGNGMSIFTGLGSSLFAWICDTFGAVSRVTAKHVQKKTRNGMPVEYGVVILRLADGTIAHVELTWAGNDSRSSFELSGDGGMLQYDSGSSAPIQVDRFSETGMIPASDTVLNEPVLKRQLNEAVTSAVSKNASDGLDHYTYAMEIVKAVTESVQKRESVALKGGATS